MAVIEVERLRKRYGDTIAVDDVSFAVEQGEIFGILGPNGAGKTTTVESIVGLRAPDSGDVRVLGLDPRRDRDELHRQVGVQLQDSALPDKLRVGEAIELYAAFYPEPADGGRLLAALEAMVKTHLIHIYGKLGVKDRAAAVAAAYDRGLLTPGSRSA